MEEMWCDPARHANALCFLLAACKFTATGGVCREASKACRPKAFHNRAAGQTIRSPNALD
jgi:hypothetical protein